MLEGAKLIGAGAATIASVGAAIGIGNVLSSLNSVGSIRGWRRSQDARRNAMERHSRIHITRTHTFRFFYHALVFCSLLPPPAFRALRGRDF